MNRAFPVCGPELQTFLHQPPLKPRISRFKVEPKRLALDFYDPKWFKGMPCSKKPYPTTPNLPFCLIPISCFYQKHTLILMGRFPTEPSTNFTWTYIRKYTDSLILMIMFHQVVRMIICKMERTTRMMKKGKESIHIDQAEERRILRIRPRC
ncbi:hypothetical protein VP01_135g1 [Puccinia sorghi]|uniref:Uncharacterized protein n=1 Tax=Puccinia sorghi TaxID=27349 RepID=A0A0L6VNN5_9BASI|nr:hypothetical protein VP01_135g1 [Puccinia sorghi]